MYSLHFQQLKEYKTKNNQPRKYEPRNILDKYNFTLIKHQK